MKNWIPLLLVLACSSPTKKFDLPVYGRPEYVEREVNGEIITDTIPHTIADFAFLNQDSVVVTNETFKDQVYVADFFFTSCPSICPVMKAQMLRVYEAYESEPKVAILSHTIDPKHDTVAVLRDFAQKLGVKSSKWHFVTGEMETIYEIGENSYMVAAAQDDEAPGGYIHSGAFLLVDQKRQIRGVYDGTVPEQVDLLIEDIKKLITKRTQQ